MPVFSQKRYSLLRENELLASKIKSNDYKNNIEILTSSNLLEFHERRNLLKPYTTYPKVKTPILKAKYKDLTSSLSKEPTIKTGFENQFFNLCKKHNNLPAPLRSLWIGNFNVDFLFPSIKGEGSGSDNTQGLAIEIDGGIHNRQFKMNKDSHKIEALSLLHIGVTHVGNDFKDDLKTINLFKGLAKANRLDSRGKERVMRRIYIYTIAYFLSNQEFKAFLEGKDV